MHPARSLRSALLLTALMSFGVTALARQDPAPPPSSDEVRGRALWDGLVAAATGEAAGRVRAFVLDFGATRYSGEKQANDVSATYSYLEPGWVRMVLKSGRERLRGPKGDFLIDKSGAHRLVGKDFKQDIQELDDTVTVARTFAHLTDPRGLELERLAGLAAAPDTLPASLESLAATLQWVTLWSRDFRGPEKGAEGSLDRIDLGIEAGSFLPRLAILTDPRSPANAMALRLEEYLPLDGFRVPGRVTAWRIDPERTPTRFGERQSLDLWLESGTLAPQLEPANFEP